MEGRPPTTVRDPVSKDEVEEMKRCLCSKEFAAPRKDLRSIPSTHVVGHNTICNSNYRGSDILYFLVSTGTAHTWYKDIHSGKQLSI